MKKTIFFFRHHHRLVLLIIVPLLTIPLLAPPTKPIFPRPLVFTISPVPTITQVRNNYYQSSVISTPTPSEIMENLETVTVNNTPAPTSTSDTISNSTFQCDKPTDCIAPPHCQYEGGSECSCGALVCRIQTNISVQENTSDAEHLEKSDIEMNNSEKIPEPTISEELCRKFGKFIAKCKE